MMSQMRLLACFRLSVLTFLTFFGLRSQVARAGGGVLGGVTRLAGKFLLRVTKALFCKSA